MLQHRISDLDIYLFGRGTHYTVYEKLGAHPAEEEGQNGVYFAVWAPNARSVSVVGDFNGWNAGQNRMNLLAESGIYDLFIPGLGAHALYKFAVETQKGDILFKADPDANQSQLCEGSTFCLLTCSMAEPEAEIYTPDALARESGVWTLSTSSAGFCSLLSSVRKRMELLIESLPWLNDRLILYTRRREMSISDTKSDMRAVTVQPGRQENRV